MNHDVRAYYRKHQTDTAVDDEGSAAPVYDVDGPYRLAFVPIAESRTYGEQGYTYEGERWLAIIANSRVFRPGDILTSDASGETEEYRVESVSTYPGEQQLEVRAI